VDPLDTNNPENLGNYMKRNFVTHTSHYVVGQTKRGDKDGLRK